MLYHLFSQQNMHPRHQYRNSKSIWVEINLTKSCYWNLKNNLLVQQPIRLDSNKILFFDENLIIYTLFQFTKTLCFLRGIVVDLYRCVYQVLSKNVKLEVEPWKLTVAISKLAATIFLKFAPLIHFTCHFINVLILCYMKIVWCPD